MLRLVIFAMTFGFVGVGFAEVPATKPETVGVSPDRLSRIRTVLQKEVDADRMPGAVVMIARRGQLIYSEAIGFQDKGAGKPMTKDAIFRIYSMTKPLASVAAMMLVEEGRIQLTDPVSKFLPQLAKMEVLVTEDGRTTRQPAKRQMTIQDLFRHTAGLAYGEFSDSPELKAAYAEAKLFQPGITAESRMITPEQFVAGIAKAPLVHEPGTTWEYSMAVDVLGRVVEVVSGQRLSAFLDERLFRPLNMTDTGFKVPEAQWSRIAEPLPKNPLTGGANEVMLDVKIEPLNDSGGGGAVSTATDYLRFCQMMLNGGTLDGRRYLSPTTIKLMTSDHLGNRPGLPLTPGTLLMGVDGYTLEAASLRDADVRLNGRPLALGPGDELPPIAGAPTTDNNTVTFKPATITFLAIPAAGNNTCRQLASNVYMGRICSHTARCGICFYLSKAVSFGHTATKRAPGRDGLVPPCRFSMLDCARCTQRSVACLRRGF